MPDVKAGQILTAATLQQFGSRPVAYTPTLTTQGAGADPVLGAGGAAQGEWTRQGDWVEAAWSIKFGTSGVSAGSGLYLIALPPVAPKVLQRVGLGAGALHDQSAVLLRVVYAERVDDTHLQLLVDGAVTVTDSGPWVWAANDMLFGGIRYLGDF